MNGELNRTYAGRRYADHALARQVDRIVLHMRRQEMLTLLVQGTEINMNADDSLSQASPLVFILDPMAIL
jgi:hypothetical protein